MSEYVKDSSKARGWKMVSYKKRGRAEDGAPITAEGMDESMDDAEEGDAEPESSGVWSLE